VDAVLGGWKLSGILTFTTGVPISITAPEQTFTKFSTGSTPDVTGVLTPDFGKLAFNGAGACFFCGFTQITDPNLANIAPALAAQSSLFGQKAPNGTILQNALPGTLGSLSQTFFHGARFFNLDASLQKAFRISERFNFELRTDWINSTNHEDFATATIDTNINSATFGRVTGPGANNNRIIVLGGRLNF
jgi:hypothetical protein